MVLIGGYPDAAVAGFGAVAAAGGVRAGASPPPPNTPGAFLLMGGYPDPTASAAEGDGAAFAAAGVALPASAGFFASPPKIDGALVLMGGKADVGAAAAFSSFFSSPFAAPAAAVPAGPNRPGSLPNDPNPPPAAGLDIKLPKEEAPPVPAPAVPPVALAKLPKPGAADFPPEAAVDENAENGDGLVDGEAPKAGDDDFAPKTPPPPPKTPPTPFAPSFLSADVGSTRAPVPNTSDPVPPLPNTGLFAGAGASA